MVHPDIQKSKNLLKRLEEEMRFLSSLMAQAMIVSSSLSNTYSSLEKIYKKNIDLKKPTG